MPSDEIIISEKKFTEFLSARYSRTTTNTYLTLFKAYAKHLTTQSAINDFNKGTLRMGKNLNKDKGYREREIEGSNPCHKGFLKSYIECFKLPFQIIKSRMKKGKQQTKIKYLEKKQIDQLINNIEDEWISILVRLMFETGLRLRELINTKVKNINLNERTISGIGKNGKQFITKFSPKSRTLLQKYLQQNKREHPFHYNNNPQEDHPRRFWYYLKKAGKLLNIENLHPHMIRHSLGHHLRADKKFDLQQIKTKLRHSQLETTSIYTTADNTEVDNKIDQEVFEK